FYNLYFLPHLTPTYSLPDAFFLTRPTPPSPPSSSSGPTPTPTYSRRTILAPIPVYDRQLNVSTHYRTNRPPSPARGRSWYALQAFSITQSRDSGLRECAFSVFAGLMILIADLQTDVVLTVVEGGGGLEDSQSPALSLAHLSLLPILVIHPPTSPIPNFVSEIRRYRSTNTLIQTAPSDIADLRLDAIAPLQTQTMPVDASSTCRS
ncbi:hypothetical protein PILCRDRAFT_15774, partial [Piloderma croceum F 1598]